MDTEIKAIEVQMQERVTKTPEWQVRDELLHSVKGVGVVTRLTLLAELPELGSMSGKKIAALVGIAPQVARFGAINDDSGKRTGKRTCWGGRAEIRATLYMATLSVVRHNPVIRE